MKVKLDQNGWTVHVTDLDLNHATKDDVDILGCLLSHYTLVVLPNQVMPIKQEEDVCRMFGTTQDELYGEAFVNKDPDGNHPLYHPEGTITFRVTGEKNKNGAIGLFGNDEELAWHSNKIEEKNRRSIVWIHGIRGTVGSETQFTNNVLAYNDLPMDVKERIQDLEIVYSESANAARDAYFRSRFNESKYDGATFGLPKEQSNDTPDTVIPEVYTPRLVHTNESGQIGLSIFPAKVGHFKGMGVEESKELVKYLNDHIMGNMKYRYCHKWKDGDLILSEQWLGLHRRMAFEGMSKRMVHRIETNFDKIDFSKMDSALAMVENTN